MKNVSMPYEKPVLVKHAQLKEVTLTSTGGNNGNNKPVGNEQSNTSNGKSAN